MFDQGQVCAARARARGKGWRSANRSVPAMPSPLGHPTGAPLPGPAGGAMLSRHISEKMVGYIGGSLFLVFAAATAFGLF